MREFQSTRVDSRLESTLIDSVGCGDYCEINEVLTKVKDETEEYESDVEADTTQSWKNSL